MAIEADNDLAYILYNNRANRIIEKTAYRIICRIEQRDRVKGAPSHATVQVCNQATLPLLMVC